MDGISLRICCCSPAVVVVDDGSVVDGENFVVLAVILCVFLVLVLDIQMMCMLSIQRIL